MYVNYNKIWHDDVEIDLDLFLKEFHDIRNQIKDLTKENQELKQMIDMIYFAPGMPGFESTEEHFESLKRKRI